MSAYLSDDLYETVTQNIPIICVDTIPVRKAEKWEVGLITRATGTQAGKLAVLGGRIRHSEKVDEAIARHLKTDLDLSGFSHKEPFSEENPFMVFQYFMQDSSDSERYGFDPSKHSLALIYLIEVDDTAIHPQNEASDFTWVSQPIVDPASMGYNQHVLVNKALAYLNR